MAGESVVPSPDPEEPSSGPGLPGVEGPEFWRKFLTEGDPHERRMRRLLGRLPASPRCKACAAPFAGASAPVMRMLGKGRSMINPNLCDGCFSFLRKHRGGAEIELTLLFADIRGSTSLAESMSATEFQALLNRFYRVATRAVFAHDGGIDKFVGDEVMAMFYPLTSLNPARDAIDAARDLLRATGHGDRAGPWLPIGAGVHSGVAWVGALGDASHVELTALGDAVNVAARLASAAAAGEVLITAATADLAGLTVSADARRTLELKGKSEAVEVVVTH